MSSAPPGRMSSLEIRASLSLASIFALRMLGLFLILPVFAVHAAHLKGGDSQTLVGIALGTYGLTQGILQIPFGMASDRYGRKPVIIFGLILFAIGSFIAAVADDMLVVILGRAIQGAGAISAAVVAFVSDLTREEHRTKAMAMVGASIGLVFALSLVAAPALYKVIGMGGIFTLTGVLALAAIWVVVSVVPPESSVKHEADEHAEPASLGEVLRNPELLRLNFGIFALHVVQMAIFVVVPLALVRAGELAVDEHWKVYLPVVLMSFVLMLPPIFMAEKKQGALKQVFLGSIVLMAVVQIGFLFLLQNFSGLVILLLGFFVAFNILEASLPSLVSRMAPPGAKGTAIGVYNTTQALGLFVGGAAGGWLAQNHGPVSVFVLGTVLIVLWGVVAAGMRSPRARSARKTVGVGVEPASDSTAA